MIYRGWRGVAERAKRVRDEFQSAPKKTLVDLLAGATAAGLAVTPVRERMLQWDYFWVAYAILLVITLLNRLAKRGQTRRQSLLRMAEAAARVQVIIEFQRKHTKELSLRRDSTAQHVQNSIASILQAIADLTKVALGVPEGVHMHANLMVPMPVVVADQAEKRHGVGIVAYSANRPPDPSWTRLVWGDLGAGQAFETGQVAVVEDAKDPIWCGIYSEVRSKSFMSFPVLTDANKVIAVVNVDATAPRVLLTKNKPELHRLLGGALRLLSDVLYSTREGAVAGARANPTLPGPQ